MDVRIVVVVIVDEVILILGGRVLVLAFPPPAFPRGRVHRARVGQKRTVGTSCRRPFPISNALATQPANAIRRVGPLRAP